MDEQTSSCVIEEGGEVSPAEKCVLRAAMARFDELFGGDADAVRKAKRCKVCGTLREVKTEEEWLSYRKRF